MLRMVTSFLVMSVSLLFFNYKYKWKTPGAQ
jgi:hypothetical protein